MTGPADPADEIRIALDREVRRRFDPDRLRVGRDPGRIAERAGPFSKVPVPVQWIGIAAAIVAAATGLRSLYIDRTSHAPMDVSEERVPDEPIRLTDDRPSAPADPAPLAGARSPHRSSDSSHVPAPAPTPLAIAENIAGASPVPADLPAPSPAPVATPGTRRTAALGRPATAPDTARGRAAPGVSATFPTAPPPDTTTSVRVTTVQFGGTVLSAEVHDVPELGATLVTIREPAGGVDSVLGDPDPHRGEPPAQDRRSGADSAPFSLRLLAGQAADSGSTEHVVLGDDLDLLTTRDPEVWKLDASRERYLEQRFGLERILALDRVQIPTETGSETSFVAVAGTQIYSVYAQDHGDGRILLELGDGLPGAWRRPTLRATFETIEERPFILAVQNRLLAEWRRLSRDAGVLFVLVARRSRADGPGSFQYVERPDQPPVLIEGDEPGYPDPARRLDAHGTVQLRVRVGPLGDVEAVEVVDRPTEFGGQYLAAAAATAVRRWSYLPARHRGEDVASVIVVSLTF